MIITKQATVDSYITFSLIMIGIISLCFFSATTLSAEELYESGGVIEEIQDGGVLIMDDRSLYLTSDIEYYDIEGVRVDGFAISRGVGVFFKANIDGQIFVLQLAPAGAFEKSDPEGNTDAQDPAKENTVPKSSGGLRLVDGVWTN